AHNLWVQRAHEYCYPPERNATLDQPVTQLCDQLMACIVDRAPATSQSTIDFMSLRAITLGLGGELRCYALPEIFLRNFPVRMRCSRLILTRPRVLSLIAPHANISFIGVQ